MTKHFTHLSDSKWETVQSLVYWTPPPQRGVPRTDFRKIWNTIFFVLTRGYRWIDIPQDSLFYCSKLTAQRWRIILKKAHVFDGVLSVLSQAGIAEKKVDLSQLAIDGSFPPGPGGGKGVEHGYKGKASLLHLVVDREGRSLWIITTNAKAIREFRP